MARVIAEDDDDERTALLLPSPPRAETMSLADRLYAADLTLATLAYQRWGQNPRGRLLWEALSHTGDGIMCVAASTLTCARCTNLT